MHEIVFKQQLAPQVTLLRVKAALIAQKQKPGQFVMVHKDERSERIPLTIANANPADNTITLIIQAVGKSTQELTAMKQGEQIHDIMGPLGMPTHVEKLGKVAVVGGGIGIAVAYPVARAMKAAGNHVIGIIGARTKELLFWENEMHQATSELYVTTDDGSYGIRGFVTNILEKFLDANLAWVMAIGPIPMMKAVAQLTKPKKVKTMVSLNPVMVDGTGMCGGCRVSIGGKIQFVCVDGPDMDGHQVDFDELTLRNRSYQSQEQAQRAASHECQAIVAK